MLYVIHNLTSPSLSSSDPLGLAEKIDADTFAQYREAELKHGRVSMLAVVGYVSQEIWRFPGDVAPGIKFADVPNGLAALNVVPPLGWFQIFFLVGAVDYYGFLRYDVGIPDLEPEVMETRVNQELTYVYCWLAGALLSSFLICRLNIVLFVSLILYILYSHGRLAMLAILELFRHDAQNLVQPGFDGYEDLITGFPFLYNPILLGDIVR